MLSRMPRHTRAAAGLAALVGAGGGCGSMPPYSTNEVSSSSQLAPAARWASDRPLLGQPTLRAALSAPSAVAYEPITFGPGSIPIRLRLTNVGSENAPVTAIRLRFRAQRADVEFPCQDSLDGNDRREPSWLAPGASMVLERRLECRMPLLGVYSIHPVIGLGEGEPVETKLPEWSVEVKESALRRSPRAFASRRGFYALMVGNGVSAPLSAEAWRRGDYHVVIGLMNGRSIPVHLGRSRLAFLVYKKGSSIPCASDGAELDAPEQLGPGELRTLQSPVACAPSEQGEYEIHGFLSLVETGEEIDIGTVSLRVTRDPVEFAPKY